MGEVPEQFQILTGSLLDLVGPQRDPGFLGRYQTSNHLVNSLAHLVAQDGTYSRLVKCDSQGQLLAALPATQAVLVGNDAGTPRGLAVDSNGVLVIAVAEGSFAPIRLLCDSNERLLVNIVAGADTLMAVAPGSEGATDAGLLVSSYDLHQLATILTDCWDTINHAIRTKEAT